MVLPGRRGIFFRSTHSSAGCALALGYLRANLPNSTKRACCRPHNDSLMRFWRHGFVVFLHLHHRRPPDSFCSRVNSGHMVLPSSVCARQNHSTGGEPNGRPARGGGGRGVGKLWRIWQRPSYAQLSRPGLFRPGGTTHGRGLGNTRAAVMYVCLMHAVWGKC